MNISKAIDILSISDIFSEDENSLKKKYRQLIKIYHPDVYNGDDTKSKEISDAYDLLKVELPKLLQYKSIETSNRQIITVGVPFDKLIEIYKGNNVSINDVTLTKSSIHAYNTIVFEDVSITHNNITNTFTNSEKVSMNREYTIWSDISVSDIFSKEHIKISVLDKELDIDISGQSTKIPFKFGDTKLNVIVNKKIRS